MTPEPTDTPANTEEIEHLERVTVLTNRDRDLFLAMLEDTTSQPNEALRAAAKRYWEIQKTWKTSPP